MATSAIFPSTPARAGMYESFYLRAVAPEGPIGVWIRHTVHKPPGAIRGDRSGAPSSTATAGGRSCTS